MKKKPRPFVEWADLEGFLAKRLDPINEGVGDWAACMKAIEDYKATGVLKALENAKGCSVRNRMCDVDCAAEIQKLIEEVERGE